MKNLFKFACFIGLTIIAASAVYITFFDEIGELMEGRIEAGQTVILVGRVKASFQRDESLNEAYLIQDPTGYALAVTDKGAPEKGSYVIIWAEALPAADKHKSPVIRELKRYSTF